MLRNIFFAGYAADYLTAVAAGCAPSDFVCLDDMHFVAALGQVQGCRDSGEAGTDNADIRGLLAE
jgi:hypothetical protein